MSVIDLILARVDCLSKVFINSKDVNYECNCSLVTEH